MPKNDLDDLACAAMDFITPLVRSPKAKGEMISGMGSEVGDVGRGLIGCVLVYTQVSRSNVSCLST